MNLTPTGGANRCPADAARSIAWTDYDANLVLAQKTRRAVRDAVISTQEARTRQRRNLGFAILGFLSMLVLLGPAVWTGVEELLGEEPTFELPTQIVVYAVAVLIVFRFGLIPLAVAIFTINMAANIPFTNDFSAWYMGNSALALLSVIALAAWGFYYSLGEQPLWKMEVE